MSRIAGLGESANHLRTPGHAAQRTVKAVAEEDFEAFLASRGSEPQMETDNGETIEASTQKDAAVVSQLPSVSNLPQSAPAGLPSVSQQQRHAAEHLDKAESDGRSAVDQPAIAVAWTGCSSGRSEDLSLRNASDLPRGDTVQPMPPHVMDGGRTILDEIDGCNKLVWRHVANAVPGNGASHDLLSSSLMKAGPHVSALSTAGLTPLALAQAEGAKAHILATGSSGRVPSPLAHAKTDISPLDLRSRASSQFAPSLSQEEAKPSRSPVPGQKDSAGGSDAGWDTPREQKQVAGPAPTGSPPIAITSPPPAPTPAAQLLTFLGQSAPALRSAALGNEAPSRGTDMRFLRMTLKPEALGDVDVTLRRRGEGLHIEISVTSRSAADALQADLGQLRSRVAQLLSQDGNPSINIVLQTAEPTTHNALPQRDAGGAATGFGGAASGGGERPPSRKQDAPWNADGRDADEISQPRPATSAGRVV